MLFVCSGFVISWLIAAVSLYAQLQRLVREITFLPEHSRQMNISRPILGKNLWTTFSVQGDPGDNYTVVQIASPTCAPCHQSLEDFLQANQAFGLGFLCLVENSEPEFADMFIAQYSPLANVRAVEADLLMDAQIMRFPTFLVVDSNGIVVKEFFLLDFLLKYLSKLEKHANA